MNEDTMKLEYELTAQDYIDFNLFHLNYSKRIRNLLFIQRFIMPLIYFALPFILARSTNVPIWLWLIVSAAIYILWVLVYPARMQKNLSKKLLKALKQDRNSKLLGKHSIIIDKGGLTDIGDGGETKVKWSSINEFVEAKDQLFIFISESKAIIIPRRSFQSEEILEIFTAKVKQMRTAS